MRAFICGLKGLALEAEERAFLSDAAPWGVILFRRNIESREQVARLTADIRAALGRDAPVLVDQEGGRVQRLAPPHWRAYPAAVRFELAGADAAQAKRLAWLGARLIAHDLREVGIDVDCLPVLRRRKVRTPSSATAPIAAIRRGWRVSAARRRRG